MKNQKIINKVINYIDIVLKYTSDNSYEQFKMNSMMVEACVFNLAKLVS